MTKTIKSMKLYSAVERIHNDLESEGFGRADRLDVDVLARFDQLHYHGTDAVDHAAQSLGITGDSRVLDVGAGFGGPARWLAARTGARVSAVELQPDMNATAADLTARCGLSERVEHVEGDILKTPLPDGAYDGVMSFLALYHIPGRNPLYPKLYSACRPGARLYVEDLYQRAEFAEDERPDLENMLYANTLPDRDGYVAALERAGWQDIEFQDMTADWTEFTQDRLAAFRAAKERHLNVHGEDVVAALDAFYDTIVRLFRRGHLGGVRLTASKP